LFRQLRKSQYSRAAGYLLCIVGGISLVISLILVVGWNAVPTLTFFAGLFLLFGWFGLLLGWVVSRKPPN